jgi:hypothetical protein
MKKIFLIITFIIIKSQEPIILLVHIGPKWLEYINTCIAQINKFNKKAELYLICEERHFLNIQNKNINLIDINKLKKTEEHLQFINNSKLTAGFWQYASERFLCIQDFMKQYNVNDVIHLESDIMVYTELKEEYKKFDQLTNNLDKIGATFDSDKRCIPGIIFIKGNAINKLALKFAKNQNNKNDMEIISLFKDEFPHLCINLPIITKEYAEVHKLGNLIGQEASNPNFYFEHADFFESIFDAAAIGQYLGGIDPIHINNGSGFINETCIFNPSLLDIEWKKTNKGYVPFAKFDNKKYKINNLHIHCKRLQDFTDKSIENRIFQIKTNLKNEIDKEILLSNDNINSLDGNDRSNKTLLMHYCEKSEQNIDAIKYLIFKGANLNITDLFGKNFLDYAVTSARIDVLDYVNQLKIKIDTKQAQEYAINSYNSNGNDNKVDLIKIIGLLKEIDAKD